MNSLALLFLSLFASSVSATTIGQYVSHPDGTSFQSFTIDKSKALYEKHSNYFDNKKDLSLGHFELTKKTDLAKQEKKLNSILTSIEEVDTFLKKKNTSFNELSSKKPHQSFLLINKYRVTKDSDLYQELKKIYDDLYQKDWKQISGIKLSDDLKKVISIKDGKKVSEEAFNMSFHCKKAVAPTVCGYKDLGILYIQ
jgi:hypothetical protein